MSRFPHLPETFILREMIELERQGWRIALYPLIRQPQAVVHQETEAWLQRVQHRSFFSTAVLKANLRTLGQNPQQYFKLLSQIVRENRPAPDFLLRALVLFPKAVHMAREMMAEGIEHIHAHYASHPALVAWIIHRLTGISYSVTVHAHDIFVRTVMLPTKLGEARFVAAISEYNRNYLADLIGDFMVEKTHIVHCGIMPDTHQPAMKPKTEERFEIITIGSLQGYKGQIYLITACRLLKERGVPFRCRIIGEGEERPILERSIAEAGLRDQVELLGAKPQSEVAQLLPTADCYVQPSIIISSGKMEGIPVSIMEAFACGLPVVASHLSGIPELVRPGETGYLVPPENPPALAEALTRVYDNPEEAAQLAHNGRSLVLAEFELTKNVQKLSYLFTHYLKHTTLEEVLT